MYFPTDIAPRTDTYFGKYSGEVTDNEDPDKQGRIKVKVPSVLGQEMEVWARPCFPYAHFFVPKVEARVWVEFEAGDTRFPLWVGTWYPVDDVPETAKITPPTNRVIETESGHRIELDDTEDAERIAITHKGDGTSVEIDKDGRIAILHHAGSTIEIDKDGNISITDEGGSTTITSDAVSIVSPSISLGSDGGSAEALVLGDSLVGVLDAVIQAVMTHTHPTGVGPSGPSPDAAGSLASYVGTLNMQVLSMQNTTD